jgi:hypothetical protein
MTEKKGWGSSVLGLFVVRDGKDSAADGADADGASGTAETSADAGAGGSGAAADAGGDAAAGGGAAGAPGTAAAAFAGGAPAAPGGQVDFAAVYTAAGIAADEQSQVTRAAELLHSLPGGGEPARQIVEAALKAFGVPIAAILTAGDKEIAALDAYVAAGGDDTRKVLGESQRRIAQFEQEIQRIRQVMDQRVAEQQGVEQACAGAKVEVSRVLEFFGHAAAAAGGAAAPHERPAPPAPSHTDPSERST